MAAECISFAGETAVLDSDTLLTLGIQFAGEQLRFQSLDDLWESLVELVYLCLAPLTDKAGSVGKKIEPVAALYQTSAKARRHVMGQAPLRKNPGGLIWCCGLLVIGVGGCRGHD